MKKLKYWWISHNLPFITTATREIKMLHAYHNELIKIDKKTAWSIVNPVIHSLKELRKNTWDIDVLTVLLNGWKIILRWKNDRI